MFFIILNSTLSHKNMPILYYHKNHFIDIFAQFDMSVQFVTYAKTLKIEFYCHFALPFQVLQHVLEVVLSKKGARRQNGFCRAGV